MSKVASLVLLIAANGCSSPSFEIASVPPDSENDAGLDTAPFKAPALDTATDSNEVSPDTFETIAEDIGPWYHDTATSDAFEAGADATGPEVDTGPPPPPPLDVYLPLAGDTWSGTPNKLVKVGDGVKGVRTIPGGYTRGSGDLNVWGDGTISGQLQIQLKIDGVVLWEKRLYPADGTGPFSFALPAPLSPGAHSFEWRVVDIFACASPSTGCGYQTLSNGSTKMRLQ